MGRRDWLALAALGCTVLAIARPQWNPRPLEVPRRARDLVIALDVSRSMLAADVFPSRLEAARIAIHEALPVLAGQRIALITFAGSAAVRVPLTLDHGFVRYMLDRADPSDMEVGSTSLQAAVEKAVGAVLTDAAGGPRDLVMFTDGEDHLSNIEKTAEMLAKCKARVLIIGLGDPVQGARVPAASGTDPWMRYKDAEVVSRLDEGTLAELIGQEFARDVLSGPHPPFRSRVSLSEDDRRGGGGCGRGRVPRSPLHGGLPVPAGLGGGAVVGRLALAIAGGAVFASLGPALAGLRPAPGRGAEAAFRTKFQQGGELLQHAQEQSAVDVSAAHSLLVDAREAFLRAALLRPGDVETARQITAVTRRLREVEKAIEEQRAEEKKRHENLSELIAQLQKLTVRQARLSQQSRQLLRRHLVPPQADLSKSSDRDNEIYDGNATENSHHNDRRLALPASTEQQAVLEGTAHLLESVKFQQDTLRGLLKQAFGGSSELPLTELDPASDLLAGAVAAQHQALAGLVPEAVQWPQVNIAFHTAAGRMRQALESLRSLQPPSTDQKDNTQPPMNDNDRDEDLDLPDSDAKGNKSKPVSPGDFQAALSLRSLPIPNYTSAEILAEESANQQRRAKQKAARAAAKVEKNW